MTTAKQNIQSIFDVIGSAWNEFKSIQVKLDTYH